MKRVYSRAMKEGRRCWTTSCLTFTHSMFLFILCTFSKISSRYIDSRTRKLHVQEMVNSWHQQIIHLTDAYLVWKSQGAPANEGACYWQLETHSIFCKCPALSHLTAHKLIRIKHATTRLSIILRMPTMSMRHLFTLGSLAQLLNDQPLRPTIAFSIEVFELYHQLPSHWVCPRLSTQAVTRALSHLHGVSCSLLFTN